jgi:hypothetical protein
VAHRRPGPVRQRWGLAVKIRLWLTVVSARVRQRWVTAGKIGGGCGGRVIGFRRPAEFRTVGRHAAERAGCRSAVGRAFSTDVNRLGAVQGHVRRWSLVQGSRFYGGATRSLLRRSRSSCLPRPSRSLASRSRSRVTMPVVESGRRVGRAALGERMPAPWPPASLTAHCSEVSPRAAAPVTHAHRNGRSTRWATVCFSRRPGDDRSPQCVKVSPYRREFDG